MKQLKGDHTRCHIVFSSTQGIDYLRGAGDDLFEKSVDFGAETWWSQLSFIHSFVHSVIMLASMLLYCKSTLFIIMVSSVEELIYWPESGPGVHSSSIY